MNIAAVGLIAGAMTTGAWLPQLYRTWRSRSARDLSWAYLLTMTTGIALWLAYGLFSGDVAVIAANAVTLLLLSGQVTLKAVGPDRLLRRDASQVGQVLVGECECGGGDVLSQMRAGRRAGNEQDVHRAVEQPRERDRHRRGADAGGNGVEDAGLQRRESA